VVPDQIIQVGTAPVNLSPDLFHEYARQYLDCERCFQTDARYSPVPYFLLCRAIELELKARHLESKSRREVKNQYGHNLKKAYDELSKSDQVLNVDEYRELVRASDIYDVPNKGFEYVSVKDAVTGLRDFPELAILRQIARKMIQE
jgi:hypothetical protein